MITRIALRLIPWILLSASTIAVGQDKLTIYTVNYPLQYFAQRIAGDHAEVVFPAPPNEDSAFWQPSVDIIAGYQQADLILLNGAGYAKWVNRVSLSGRKLLDTSAGFSDRYIHLDEGLTHSHGPTGDHSHAGTAFTTWLDFSQATRQARAIADAMSRKRPGWNADFSRNLAALEADLMELDQQIESIVAAMPEQPLLASHPVYQYLQRRYGLNLKSMMWEPGQMPDKVQWSAFEQILGEHPARWMIWEAEPVPEVAQRLLGMGVDSLVFNPAGNKPDEGDFLSLMRQNVGQFKRAFR